MDNNVPLTVWAIITGMATVGTLSQLARADCFRRSNRP